MTSTPPVRRQIIEEGQVWRLTLATPKANILDQEKSLLLTSFFDQARSDATLKVIILDSEGPHYSFGASVEEHLPGRYESMIPTFHRLLYALLNAQVNVFAAIRGQCLGGGLEFVSLAHRIFAHPEARFGQPEIRLGVFPPVASVYLSERTGRGAAEDLCLSGRSIETPEAHRIGLVDQVEEDPTAAALAWAREHYLPRSAKSLRLAVQAVRHGLNRRFREELAAVEKLYLGDLMATEDALEGLTAFVEKRPPQWRDR